jgi:hypothetical protein
VRKRRAVITSAPSLPSGQCKLKVNLNANANLTFVNPSDVVCLAYFWPSIGREYDGHRRPPHCSQPATMAGLLEGPKKRRHRRFVADFGGSNPQTLRRFGGYQNNFIAISPIRFLATFLAPKLDLGPNAPASYAFSISRDKRPPRRSCVIFAVIP